MKPTQQKAVLVSLYISYMLCVYIKRSVSSAMPAIVEAENLGKEELGLIFSCQMFAYTLSKFLCGVIMDSISPRLFLCFGLLASGVTVLAFAAVPSSVLAFAFLWFLNGVANGPGWPALALILKSWCRGDQFGTAWTVLSTSRNLAGTLGPLVAAYIVTSWGWRTSLVLPGVLALLFGIVVLLVVEDKPQDDGDTDDPAGEKEEAKTASATESDASISRFQLFGLPGFKGICLTYFAVSVVQYGLLQWGPLYLVQDTGHSIFTGNGFVSSLEVGGILGSVVAGYLSDFIMSKIQRADIPNHITRQIVISWFSMGNVIFLMLFLHTISSQSSMMWINFVGLGLGFTIYGPVAVFGVVAMETAPSHLAGMAHAVAALFASAGQMAAGLPLGFIAELWGWQTTFMLQTTLIMMSTFYLFMYTMESLPLRRETQSVTSPSEPQTSATTPETQSEPVALETKKER